MYFDIDYNDGLAIVDTIKFNSQIKTRIVNNNPIVDIALEGEGRIIETDGNINLEDNNVIKNLQDKANKKIEEFVKKAIVLSIENIQ